jgi:hypothetical protein
MMFESRREKENAVTLCVFPHLREFIAVDSRPNLPDRPKVCVLNFSDVHGDSFYSRIEQDFSKLLRRPDQTVLNLMGLPQEVEGLVRSHSLRRVMEALNKDLASPPDNENGSVGVLFFAGGLLYIADEQLREVVKDVFGQALTPGQVRQLHSQIEELLKKEREAVSQSSRNELAKLIRGDDGPYVTLWNRES